MLLSQPTDRKPVRSTLRYAGSMLIGAAVAAVMFYGMYFMVKPVQAKLSEQFDTRLVDFVRARPEARVDEPTRNEQPKREPPPEIQPAPPTPDAAPKSSFTPMNLSAEVPTEHIRPSMSGNPFSGVMSDRDEVPLVRIEPQFPPDAAQRGVEGWVDVRFDVDRSGRVMNAAVIKSHPPGVFDQETLRAVKKWKYRPKVVDGKATERKNIVVRIDFKLEST